MHITSYKKCAEISRRAHYVCDPLVEAGLLKLSDERFVLFDGDKVNDHYEINFQTCGSEFRMFKFKLEGNDEWNADNECQAKVFLNSLIAYRQDINNAATNAREEADRILRLLKLKEEK